MLIVVLLSVYLFILPSE